jgi:ElaB/YqjD/DUF883 family membrane-anchored ribosome-binding protein
MGSAPSSSDSLFEQAKQTATVTYDIAKDKAAPMIEKARPALESARETLSPVVTQAKDTAVSAYESAQNYLEENPESKVAQAAHLGAEYYEKGKDALTSALSQTETGQKVVEKASELKD